MAIQASALNKDDSILIAFEVANYIEESGNSSSSVGMALPLSTDKLLGADMIKLCQYKADGRVQVGGLLEQFVI